MTSTATSTSTSTSTVATSEATTTDAGRTDTTRLLLGCGVVAGPLYLIAGFAQAFTRDGFDLTRHPFSFLALGDGGWVQIANFVVTGLLFLAAAIGVHRTRAVGRWVPILLGVFAVGMIGGGVFVADPAFGFPAGAPEGQASELSWHGVLHGVAFVVSFPALVASFFVLARKWRGPWARGSVAAGVLALVPLPFLGTEPGTVLLYGAAIVGWLWASAVAAKLRSGI